MCMCIVWNNVLYNFKRCIFYSISQHNIYREIKQELYELKQKVISFIKENIENNLFNNDVIVIR